MILLAATTAARCAEMITFRVGIAAPTVNMLPLWTAQQAGLFKARGLDVQVINTDGGSRGLSGVGAGRLQAMMVGLSSVIDANDKGGDYRLIASGANTMSFRFFGAHGVGDAAALKGKMVGVSAFGSESDSAATMALKQLGLSRGDVRIVEAGGTLKRLAALRSGVLAATALNEPADTEAKRGNLPLLADLKADLPWIFTAVAVDRKTLASHPQQFRAFLQAYVEGIYLALSDSTRSRQILDAQFPGFSPEALDATWQDFRARVPRDAEPSRAGAELMMRELHARKGMDDYIDASLIAELQRSGVLDQLRRQYQVQ
jgi:ABC-type nitrate/sulfonate/bicarbonate transport system substrate-binding protein